MSTASGAGSVSLTASQILTVRGAANAIVDAIDAPDVSIDDQFDPVRRDHLAAASEELAEALATLAPEGRWRGHLPPSEQQALRDAIGAVEAMVTPPHSERLGSLGYRVDEQDMAALGSALEGVPAPDPEDLAYSDFRYGGTDDVLRERTRWDEAMTTVREALGGLPGDPPERERQLTEFDGRQLRDASCAAIDRLLIQHLAIAASLHNTQGYRFTREHVATTLYSNVEDIVDGDRFQHDCYSEMDERRIRAAQRRLSEAIERGDLDAAEAHAFGAAEMVLWAESNRLREQRFGLR